MEFQMNAVEKDGVKMAFNGNVLLVSGNIASQDPGEFLDPFLSQFHEKLVENNSKEITLDIRELAFLNSAGIRSLVDWVLRLEQLPEEKKYKIDILCNTKYHWQNISINSLIYLSPASISKRDG